MRITRQGGPQLAYLPAEEQPVAFGVHDEVAELDGVLVIRRIVVTYRIALPEQNHVMAHRVVWIHARACPVARSLEGANPAAERAAREITSREIPRPPQRPT